MLPTMLSHAMTQTVGKKTEYVMQASQQTGPPLTGKKYPCIGLESFDVKDMFQLQSVTACLS